MSRKAIPLLSTCFIIAIICLAACGNKEVIKTVVITQEVKVAGTPVIQQVVVTATPKIKAPTQPGPRTLVICLGQEPDTLFLSNMAVSGMVLSAIYDGPIDGNNFAFQPVILEKLPSLADGDAEIQRVEVNAGDTVIADDGNLATLAVKSGSEAGTVVRPAGCRSTECAVEYDGVNVKQMDRMVVTSRLIPGILWSDGTPLTAADSVYAFQVFGDPAIASSRFAYDRTASYIAKDELTTVWTGIPGFYDSTYMLDFWSPLPKHVMGQYSPADLVTQVDAQRLWTGWGPYIIDEWQKGVQISLHKNPNYFRADEGLPHFDNLVFRFTAGDPSADIAAVLAGDCDIVDLTDFSGQSQLLLELQAKNKIDPSFVTGTKFEHISFNIRPAEEIINSGAFAGWDLDGDGQGPFGDVRLRRAIAMCLDRQAIVDTVVYGQSQVLDTYLPPNHPLFATDARHWPYDPSAAEALLNEIGWKDLDNDASTPRLAQGVTGVPDNTPLKFRIETTDAPTRQQMSQLFAQNLASCGIQVDLGFTPAQVYFATEPDGIFFGRRFDLVLSGWMTGSEPLCNLFLSKEAPSELNSWGGLNITGFNDPAYDAACLTALQSLPGEEAYTTNHLAAQRIIADQIPMLALHLSLKLAITRPDMCNFIMDPTGSEMWNLEKFDFGPGCEE